MQLLAGMMWQMSVPMSRRGLVVPVLGVLAGAGLLARTGHSQAHRLPRPTEPVILNVSGRIGVTNRDGAAEFDRPMLEGLGMTGFETNTPWYDGPVRFDGVRMDRLMQAVDASGETILAYALNDYSTEIPVGDFARYNVLLALKRNGLYMPIRDKGPLFIVYPYDSDSQLRHQRFYSRSAWQLARIVVR